MGTRNSENPKEWLDGNRVDTKHAKEEEEQQQQKNKRRTWAIMKINMPYRCDWNACECAKEQLKNTHRTVNEEALAICCLFVFFCFLHTEEFWRSNRNRKRNYYVHLSATNTYMISFLSLLCIFPVRMRSFIYRFAYA